MTQGSPLLPTYEREREGSTPLQKRLLEFWSAWKGDDGWMIPRGARSPQDIEIKSN